MRQHEPFQAADLRALDDFLHRGEVVSMNYIHAGATFWRQIGMRHDCDNVIDPAVRLAAWEAERGYRSTYYILHTSPYWANKVKLRAALERIAEYGHEIGIHNDAITVHRETGRDPADVLHEAIDELRRYGHTIRSTVAHGNRRCHVDHYVNDEMFVECYRDTHGDIGRLGITPISMAVLDLDFDANWLHRGDYLSDSGGAWSRPFHEAIADWPGKGQLHILQHPDWWGEALAQKVAA